MVAWDAHNVYGVVRIHDTLLNNTNNSVVTPNPRYPIYWGLTYLQK